MMKLRCGELSGPRYALAFHIIHKNLSIVLVNVSSLLAQLNLNKVRILSILVKGAGMCLIPRGSTVHMKAQAKGSEFRESIVKPLSKFTVTNIGQQTPSIQRTSRPCLASGSRPVHYTQNYVKAFARS